MARRGSWQRYYRRHTSRLLARNRTEKARRGTRDKHLRTKYGIGLKEYAAMLKAQDGKCAICKATPRAKGRRIHGYMHFAVDHNHKTGEVRGLLCAKCNGGIGFLKDDPTVVKAALTYLLKA